MGRPRPQERSHLSCSRTCFLGGALVGGGWVMAAPRDKAVDCCKEHPPKAWTMLGWVLAQGQLTQPCCLPGREGPTDAGIWPARWARRRLPNPGQWSVFIAGVFCSPQSGPFSLRRTRSLWQWPGQWAFWGYSKGKVEAWRLWTKIEGSQRRKREGRPRYTEV